MTLVPDFPRRQASDPGTRAGERTGDPAMSTPSPVRNARGEAIVRSLLAFALILAVAWALAGGGDPSQGFDLAVIAG